MVQVYAEPYVKRHYAGRCSAAWCLPFFGVVVAVIISFVLALSTGELWIKEHTFSAQPDVKFTYEVLLVLETGVPGEERVWSSVEALNELYYDQLVAVDVQATETDTNYDGKADLVDVKITSHGVAPVHSVKLLMGFDYKLSGATALDMRTLAYVAHASPLAGAALHVDGELQLRQREPLPEGGRATTHRGAAGSPFAALLPGVDGTTGLAALQLGGVFNQYLFRNETTVYDYAFPVWHAGSGGEFEVKARVRIPPHQEVKFRPGPLTVAKFGWVQIFAFLFPLLWLLSQALWVVYHYRVLYTRVVSDLSPKTHRF